MRNIYIFMVFICSLYVNAQTQIQEGFDNAVPPTGWVADLDSNIKVIQFTSSGQETGQDSYAKFSVKSYSDKTTQGWLITSKMSVEASKSYDYSFYVKTGTYKGATYKFTYGNAQTRTAQTTVLKEITSPLKTNNWVEVKGQFIATATGDIYFGFRYDWASDGLGIDSVVITETPSCTTPDELTFSSITSNQATLSWIHNATNVQNYTVKVVTKDQDVDTATAIFESTTTNKTMDLTGLMPNTEYDVYIKTDCNPTDGQSVWTKKKTLKTACGSVNSLSEDFSNQNSDNFIDCWSRLVDKGQYNYSSIRVSYSSDIHFSNYYSNTTDKLLLITPELANLQANVNYQLRFKAKLYSSSTITEKIEVGTITDPSDKTTFTKLKEFDLTDEYQEFLVDFSTYSGNDKYIAFNRSTTQKSASITTNLDDVYWEPLPTKWVGNNSNWKDASNWASGAIPTANESVAIKGDASKYPEISNDISVGNVFIEPNANLLIKATGSLTAESVSTSNNLVIESNATSSGNFIANSVNGNVTYKLLTSGQWQMIGAPVAEQSIQNFVASSPLATGTVDTNNKGLAKYDSSKANPWIYYQSSVNWGDFKKGVGYAIKTNGAKIVSFTGKVNTKKIVHVTYSEGFKLISNPYTASLSVNGNSGENFLTKNNTSLKDANVGLYYWNATKNKYEVINNASSIQKLSPGQGVFVNPASGYENFTFSTSMVSNQSTPLLKRLNQKQTSVEIIVQANNNKSQTEIKYLDVATNGLDKGYDAGFFNANNTQLNLYSKLVDGSYADTNFMLQCINHSNLEEARIPLGVRIKKPGKVIFSAKSLNLPEGIKVFLEDKQENKVVELNENETYKVNLNSSSENRFVVHTKKQAALSIESEILTNVFTYQLGNKLYIKGLQGNKALVKIYNMLGSEMLSTKISNSNTVNLKGMSKGVYVVKVNSNTKVSTQKIILK